MITIKIIISGMENKLSPLHPFINIEKILVIPSKGYQTASKMTTIKSKQLRGPDIFFPVGLFSKDLSRSAFEKGAAP